VTLENPSAIPSEVIWSYLAGGVVAAIWLVNTTRRGAWSKARGLEKVILLGPVCYAAPVAAFGAEHFSRAQGIASIVPVWIPWHLFWAYFLGACFIAAAVSLVTGIQARLAASLLALTFFLFVVLMDIPGWAEDPHDRIAFTLALRELSFSGGALALAASLTSPGDRRRDVFATIARYFVAVPVVVYSFEQFTHGSLVPGVPLKLPTPDYVFGHAIWTYLAAVVYAVTGILLLLGKKTRAAAAWLGLTVLFLELVVYVPIAVVQRASIDNGLNYFFDTLMYGGAILLLAVAMPHEAERVELSTSRA
jgi:uncharacterized membrane protein YphA (DoxX/SURF4 family)